MCGVLYGVDPDKIIFDEIKIRDLVPGGSFFDFTARPYITANGISTPTFDSVNAEFTVIAGDRLFRVKGFEGGFISGEKRDSLITCYTGSEEPHHVFKENTLSTGQIALTPEEKTVLGLPAEDVPLHAVRDITDQKIISCSLEGKAFDGYTPIEHILSHISARSLGFTDKELIPNDVVLKSLKLLDQISVAAQGSGAYVIKNHVAIPVSEVINST